MAAYDKQFLDNTGLNTTVNALWTKTKKIQPFYNETGTAGTAGWVKFLTVKCTTYMNHPLVAHILSRGYSSSTMEVQFNSVNNTTPTVHGFYHRIQSFNGYTSKSSNVGYVIEDVDGIRYYHFWKKKNEGWGDISVNVDAKNFYINGTADTGILTFPNEQSDTEPAGITYATEVWETVPKQTAYTAKGTATKVPQITTNAQGQVTGITEVEIAGVTPASHSHGSITNDGNIGTTADLPVITGTGGAVTTGSFSTTASAVGTSSAAGTANTFSRGDHVHSISLATGDSDGQVKIAGSNVSVAGWDKVALSQHQGTKQYHIQVSNTGSNPKGWCPIVRVTKTSGYGSYDAIRVSGTFYYARVNWESDYDFVIDFQAIVNISANTAALYLGKTKMESVPLRLIKIADRDYELQYNASVANMDYDIYYQVEGNAKSYTTFYTTYQASTSTGTAITSGKRLEGNIAYEADKLSTSRTIRTDLSSTSTASFDGSANITPGVTGTLPIANGGTGATTVNGAQYNLLGSMAQATSDFGDSSLVACRLVSPSAENGAMVYRTGTNVWSWVKGKLSSDTGVNISGNAATATSAGKLTTARELAVSLSNTSTTTTFDGSANVTNIKVSGTLPVANGGTGSTTAAGARTNLSVYSKSEVDSLMSGRIEVVTELPATGQSGIIYYVGPTGSGADQYDEYIWTGSAFIKVGEHSLDLSNYVNTVTTSGSGSVVTGVSKSGSTVTVTKGNISLDDLSDWATETDVTISNVTYHTMWPVAPTSSNQVYGISINNGRLFRIYNNKGAYSAQAYDQDSDTTYTPQKLGIGYGTCTTAEATAAKVVTLTDYVLVTNGIVAVKFSYPLCASATLNINGKGAKPVYVGGAAVTSTNCKSVQAGDIGYFIYDGTAYHFLGTDRADKSAITGLSVSGKTVTYTRADGETGTFDTQDTTYAFADSYNASTNKGATVATVTNAINALDVSDISGFGAGKTLATLAETNGKISATFQNISITKSQVSDFSHGHGNISSAGALTNTGVTIANGDMLVIADSSDSSKVARASISFDGSTTTTALTPKGTFEAFAKSSEIPVATTTTPKMDGTAAVGSETKWAKGDHVHPTDTSRAPTSHASSATTYGVGTTANYGHVKLDNSTPLTVGTTSSDGVATGKAHIHNALESVARASVTTADLDHVHTTNERAHMILSQITSATSTTHYPGDGYMLSFMWDNTGKYDAQVFIPDAGITSATDFGRLKVRYCNNSAWGDWGYLPLAADCATLTNSDDLDNIKGSAAGQVLGYRWSSGAVPANAPVSTATSSMLVYQTHSAYCYQVVFTARDGVYRRLCNNGTWEAWSKELVAADIATGTVNGTISVAGTDVKVNGWDALTDRVENLEESGDVGFMGNATQDGERLIFEDIIFDSIYPSIGKYGLATFPETTSTDATEFSGDRDWLLDWRPYLVDMSPVAGETAKAPVAELQKDNWLRTKDGDYAPVCGITSAQSTALDGKKDTLYWKSGSTGDKVSATVPAAFDSSGNFAPAKFWEFVKANLSTVNTAAGVTYTDPISVKVYVGTQAYEFGSYTNYHIPAPWETTETKYSVFIGRPSDVYVVDGYSATTGEHMRGLCSKPLPVGTNKFDPEDFKLRRTGISPGPSTVVASKIRNFFYNYVVAVSSNCTVCGNAGRTSIFYNNGTYPATNGPTQYRCADWSRACNSGGSSGNAVPVGEMGYHALNAFLCSVEAAYGTRNLWEYNRFSEGICSNYSASATNGGVLLDGSTWKMWSATEATLSSTSENYSVAVNGQYAKFQCMEPQIAASLATEMEIASGTSFHWNGGDWHFEVPSNLGTVKTLGGGAMNCRMYKLTDAKTVNGHTVRCNLVCALAEGVNPVGDIWWYVGGGAELVYLTDGTGNTNYKASFYLEPDQAKWVNTSTTEKITSGTFAFESSYMKLLDASTAGGLGNAYCLARTGYTPVRRVSGGAYNTGECTYQYRQIDDDTKGSAGIRSRRRLLFRGHAAITSCSPRYLAASYRPSNSSVSIGCSAQVLLA